MASVDPKELLDILNDGWGQDRYSKSSTIKELLNGADMASEAKYINDWYNSCVEVALDRNGYDVVKKKMVDDKEEEEKVGTFMCTCIPPKEAANMSDLIANLKSALEEVDTAVAGCRGSAESITQHIKEVEENLDSSGDSDLSGDDGGFGDNPGYGGGSSDEDFSGGGSNDEGGYDGGYDDSDMSDFGGESSSGGSSGGYDSSEDSYSSTYNPVDYEKYDPSKYKTSLSDSNSSKSIIPSRVGDSVSSAADDFKSSISNASSYTPSTYKSSDYTKDSSSKYFDDDKKSSSDYSSSYIGTSARGYGYSSGTATDEVSEAIQNASNEIIANTIEAPNTEYAAIPSTGANPNIVTKQVRNGNNGVKVAAALFGVGAAGAIVGKKIKDSKDNDDNQDDDVSDQSFDEFDTEVI